MTNITRVSTLRSFFARMASLAAGLSARPFSEVDDVRGGSIEADDGVDFYKSESERA